MDKPPIARGFRARRRPVGHAERVPPGQQVVGDFPVLTLLELGHEAGRIKTERFGPTGVGG